MTNATTPANRLFVILTVTKYVKQSNAILARNGIILMFSIILMSLIGKEISKVHQLICEIDL